MTTETRANPAADDAETGNAGELATVSTGRVNGRFAPGNKLGPGRPRRGQSVPEKLKAKVERHGDKVVDAAFQRLMRVDSVGNRAFADMRDTIYGIPKQTLVLEQADDRSADFLASVILGEFKVQDRADQTSLTGPQDSGNQGS